MVAVRPVQSAWGGASLPTMADCDGQPGMLWDDVTGLRWEYTVCAGNFVDSVHDCWEYTVCAGSFVDSVHDSVYD